MELISINEITNNLNDLSWSILHHISENSEISFVKLKNAIGFSQEKTYKEIARLEGAMMIQTKQDPVDQRRVLYLLSPYGKKALEIKKESKP